MKVLVSIAKNEFRYLFYSPIAWFFLILFLVQCAVVYGVTIYDLASLQEVAIKNSPLYKGASESLTKAIFYTRPFMHNISVNLYLFIPILTMSLFSREVNAGTVALLFSSPVNLRKVVLGKFVGIMLYNLLLLLVVVMFLVAGYFNIQNADYGVLMSAALGFFLLLSMYSAIGMFMSTLSEYQIISALSTFVLLFILSHIGTLWQRYEFIGDLTYFLSTQNRTQKMLYGLIDSKDVIYFALITLLFIAFTFIRLRNSIDWKPSWIKTARYLSVFLVVVIVGYGCSSSAMTWYWDTTSGQKNTIHPKTQAVISEFVKDSALEVTLYTNLLGEGVVSGLPQNRNSIYLSGFWERYIRFKPDIKFKYAYYYDNDPASNDSALYNSFPGKSLTEIAEEVAELIDADMAIFTTPGEMRQEIDLKSEGFRLVMQLKYQGRTAFVRVYDDEIFWPNESNMVAAFERVLGTDMPKVGFVSGGLERSIVKTGEREYAIHSAFKGFRGSLQNIGFDVDTVNLALQDIPDDLTALVLADPKIELSHVAMDKLKNYIDKGGNLMVSSEPGKQHVVNPLLSHLGVQLMNGQILQPSFNELPDMVFPYLSMTSAELSEDVIFEKIKAGDTLRLSMPGVAAVAVTEDKGFHSDSLAITIADKTWLKAGAVVIDSIVPPFNALDGDVAATSFRTVEQLTRQVNGKKQRIIISGDADFASNLRLGVHPLNLIILTSMYSWLVDNQFPVYMPRPSDKDLLLNIGERAAYYQKIMFVWILPALILLGGTTLLIRRKRK